MSYYVYLLKAVNPGVNKSYVGYTNDLKLRLKKHNSNSGAKSTKGYKWLLIYSKKFKTKSSAMSYEYKLKKNYSLRKKIKESSLLDEKI
jgi:putative endonuclease